VSGNAYLYGAIAPPPGSRNPVSPISIRFQRFKRAVFELRIWGINSASWRVQFIAARTSILHAAAQIATLHTKKSVGAGYLMRVSCSAAKRVR
jgi:hypothetical protein